MRLCKPQLPKKRQLADFVFDFFSVLAKTIDSLDAFARFKKKETVEAVERLLNSRQEFTRFERAQLGIQVCTVVVIAQLNAIGTLCCGKADEAKTIIPSLADKINDDDLQDLLDEMGRIMELQDV